MSSSTSYSIIDQLWVKNRNFCSSEYDASIELLKTYLPFRSHLFHDAYNGWEIPPKWDLIQATIKKNRTIIFETSNPLQVIGLSSSFSGKVDLDTLKKHLYFDHRDPKAIPYHFRQNYRPWSRDWGFCIPKELYDSLEGGEYDITIDTNESKGYLHVIDFEVKGELEETIAFVAHLDHPHMANDDLAGVAVGVELFQMIAAKPRKLSYRLVILQEVIGSVYYLHQEKNDLNQILESCFLEMLGSKTAFALQSSYHAQSELEFQLDQTLASKGISSRKGPFRSIISNDESVWESYGIPMASLSRYPYPEYHSDKDNISIIDRNALNEAVDVLYSAVEEMDKKTLLRKKFEGVIALANPKYNLYIDPGQLAFGIGSEVNPRLRMLMDLLPLAPKQLFVENLARQVDLPVEQVLSYLRLWEKKGLIDLH